MSFGWLRNSEPLLSQRQQRGTSETDATEDDGDIGIQMADVKEFSGRRRAQRSPPPALEREETRRPFHKRLRCRRNSHLPHFAPPCFQTTRTSVGQRLTSFTYVEPYLLDVFVKCISSGLHT